MPAPYEELVIIDYVLRSSSGQRGAGAVAGNDDASGDIQNVVECVADSRSIARDIQFHPVSDQPIHFDLFRVDEHQLVKIAVPVHFSGQDTSPGLKRGGALNIAFHTVEVQAHADEIPEEIVVDLSGLDIGQTVHIGDLKLPKGVTATQAANVVVATVTGSSAQASEDAAAAAEATED